MPWLIILLLMTGCSNRPAVEDWWYNQRWDMTQPGDDEKD